MKYLNKKIILLALAALAFAVSNGAIFAQIGPRAGTVGDGTPGSCTEAALQTALNGGGLVNFNCGAAPHTISITTSMNLTLTTTIDGGNLITLDGGDTVRVFILAANNLVLQNITIANSYYNLPGGVINVPNGTTLTATNVTFSSNHTDDAGGAINVTGTGVVNITNSTFTGNSADGNGGALTVGGVSGGVVTVTNSTFNDNTADNGGAVRITGGSLDINFSTFVDNNATLNGEAISQGTGGTITIKDSIFDGPELNQCTTSAGVFTLVGNNIADTGTTCQGAAVGALLLAGPTGSPAHYVPGTGSAAIDGASNCNTIAGPALTTDQIGAVRPGTGSSVCDSGSIEVQGIAVTPTETPTEEPTDEPTATDTPEEPTATDTPEEPTATDTPTDEATTEPTETPIDTNTPGGPTETPTDEATATDAGPTNTPEEPTATPTEEIPGVELIQNGDFENLGTDGKPDVTPWVVKNSTGDKAKCNKDKDGDGIPDKIFANTGNCAFQFKGVPGEAGKVQQSLDLTGVTLNAGDALNLTFAAQTKGAGLGKTKLVFKYGDDTKTKIAVNITDTAEVYAPFAGSETLTSSDVAKAKINFKMTTESGKLFVDGVSLRLVPGSGGGLIGLPDARLNSSN